jgi:preprotein translocase subunit SecY
MTQSATRSLLRNKVLKILTLLLLVRLGLYIPVPGVELDIFTQGQAINPMFGFAKTLVGNSFLGIGSLGILPYINASIVIQLLTPIFPNLERLQKEEGELGRQQISRYTRYLTFFWALILSSGIALVLIKPVTFGWSLKLGLEIVTSLTVGSILSLWFAELITEEGLGNGSSLIIFINIVGGLPNNLSMIKQTIFSQGIASGVAISILTGIAVYFGIALLIIFFQDSYKKIRIVSAKQLNLASNSEDQASRIANNSFIPLKLNQGGIMPLVFSSTIAIVLIYPMQILLSSLSFIPTSGLASILAVYSFSLNFVLVIFFSCFYVSLVLKPKDMAENLGKMAYSIPGIRQGKDTTKYLEKVTGRLAFIGGLFLAFLAFSPILVGNLLQFSLFKNLTSLLILIGVITDTTSQVTGYLVSTRYEGFKKS